MKYRRINKSDRLHAFWGAHLDITAFYDQWLVWRREQGITILRLAHR